MNLEMAFWQFEFKFYVDKHCQHIVQKPNPTIELMAYVEINENVNNHKNSNKKVKKKKNVVVVQPLRMEWLRTGTRA